MRHLARLKNFALLTLLAPVWLPTMLAVLLLMWLLITAMLGIFSVMIFFIPFIALFRDMDIHIGDETDLEVDIETHPRPAGTSERFVMPADQPEYDFTIRDGSRDELN